jgi:hypothetical protein
LHHLPEKCKKLTRKSIKLTRLEKHLPPLFIEKELVRLLVRKKIQQIELFYFVVKIFGLYLQPESETVEPKATTKNFQKKSAPD